MSIPLDMSIIPQELVEEFYSRINMADDPDECWEWTGGKSHKYGEMRAFRKYLGTSRAHRIVKMLELGIVLEPYAEVVCHHCDNPACCNSKHLYVGTQSDNILDVCKRSLMPSHITCRPYFNAKEANKIRKEISSFDGLRGVIIRQIAKRENISVRTIDDVWLKHKAYKEI